VPLPAQPHPRAHSGAQPLAWGLDGQGPASQLQGKPLKILYATQPEVAPPTFVFFVNHPEFVTRAFENYLRNRIGEDLGLKEVPFRLVFRGRREEG
jgi:predicted GTPase